MTTKQIIALVQEKIRADVDGVAGNQTWDKLYEFLTKMKATDDIKELISEVQRIVGVHVDGIAGDITWKGIFKFIFQEVGGTLLKNGSTTPEKLDSLSEKCLVSLDGEVQILARALVKQAEEAGITIKVISGLRSFKEQDKLFAQGRTEAGTIVTNARGGHSNHNFGLAFDIGVYEQNQYRGESPKYKKVGAIGKSIGLSWGGDWKSILDMPHFELRPDWAKKLSEREMLAELRMRKQKNISFFAPIA